jgi:hypothetical protein
MPEVRLLQCSAQPSYAILALILKDLVQFWATRKSPDETGVSTTFFMLVA